MLFGYPALKNDFYNMFELQIHLIHSSTIDCWLCLNQHFSKGQIFFSKVKKGDGPALLPRACFSLLKWLKNLSQKL